MGHYTAVQLTQSLYHLHYIQAVHTTLAADHVSPTDLQSVQTWTPDSCNQSVHLS